MPTTGNYTPFENTLTAPLPHSRVVPKKVVRGNPPNVQSFSVRSFILCGEKSSPRYERKQINSDK